MGLAPVLVDSIFDTIQQLHQSGTTILLVEQNARMALQIADRGYVMQTGEIVLQGSAESLRTNEMVQRAYLGSPELVSQGNGNGNVVRSAVVVKSFHCIFFTNCTFYELRFL